jgi:hypothetical protein
MFTPHDPQRAPDTKRCPRTLALPNIRTHRAVALAWNKRS